MCVVKVFTVDENGMNRHTSCASLMETPLHCCSSHQGEHEIIVLIAFHGLVFDVRFGASFGGQR
jgi:hypothetical protein